MKRPAEEVFAEAAPLLLELVRQHKNADRGSLRSTSGQGGSPAATSEDAA